MKKIAVSTIVIIALVLYGIVQNKTFSSALPVGKTSTSASLYKDGSYTGSTENAYWGDIQVQATISGGKLTNVQFLQYPSDRGKSVEINQYADPLLGQEAIQAQSSQVDVVSGATDTSNAFIQSLSSALDQAKS